MNTKNVSLQINVEHLETINLLSERAGQSQTDFINELLCNALTYYHLIQTGGLILTIPNVQFYHIDKEKALDCIEKVTHISKTCTQANIPNGFMAYAEYLKARLFADNQERVDFFKSNLEMRTSANSTQSDK